MYDLLAALSFLPLKPVPWAFGDQRKNHANRRGLSMTTMILLDALAALAVSGPDDIYATALTLPPQPLALYVSAQLSVPPTVTKHLQNIWLFLLQSAHKSSQSADSGSLPIGQCYGFIASQMRYSWTDLCGRLQVDGAVIIATLITVLAQLPNPSMSTTPSPEGQDQSRRAQLGENMREPLIRLLQSFQNLRSAVLAAGVLENSMLLRTFSEICQLHQLVFDPDGGGCRLSDLEFLVVLVSPVMRQVAGSLDKNLLLKAAVGTDRRPKIRADLEDLLETYVFDRVDIILKGDKDDPTSDISGVLHIPLHPELALVAHLDSLPYTPYSYVGMSEPACLFCHEFLAAYTEVSFRRQLHMRGSDCRLPFPWVPPSLHGDHGARVMRNFVDIVSMMFTSACSELYTQLRTSGR
ncbi:hypothetical protein EXIGLDRAFT_762910 [Exidia glandulosa HHB12029]|uniref:Uncharacterized protein n=1 Tax=Exidia glandulosa HHB12029 TaxID=1314781 RepID=A0A165ME84_EXIGL|nr:hypothetical protein EXIGLDRAFT_762910 [Exidia glandulosa HHB12029]